MHCILQPASDARSQHWVTVAGVPQPEGEQGDQRVGGRGGAVGAGG